MIALRSRGNTAILVGILLLSGGCATRHGEPPNATVNAPPTGLQIGTPEMVTGNVIIRSAANGPNYEIIADLRNGLAAPDGVPDRLWVLQREPPRIPIGPARINGAHLYSRGGELIVAAPDGTALVFALPSFPPGEMRSYPPNWQAQREQFLAGRRIAQRYEGVGLAQYWGRLPIRSRGLFRS